MGFGDIFEKVDAEPTNHQHIQNGLKLLQKTKFELNVEKKFENQMLNISNVKIPVFNANRPFLFFVENEASSTILLSGKVYDPSKLVV